MEWIDVKERLPNEGQKVLIARREGSRRWVEFSTYLPDKYKEYPWASEWGNNGPSVTHWMEFTLPDPPKEDSHAG